MEDAKQVSPVLDLPLLGVRFSYLFVPSPPGYASRTFLSLPLGYVSHTLLSLPLGYASRTFLSLPSGYASHTFLSPPLGVCFTYLFLPSPRGVLQVGHGPAFALHA